MICEKEIFNGKEFFIVHHTWYWSNPSFTRRHSCANALSLDQLAKTSRTGFTAVDWHCSNGRSVEPDWLIPCSTSTDCTHNRCRWSVLWTRDWSFLIVHLRCVWTVFQPLTRRWLNEKSSWKRKKFTDERRQLTFRRNSRFTLLLSGLFTLLPNSFVSQAFLRTAWQTFDLHRFTEQFLSILMSEGRRDRCHSCVTTAEEGNVIRRSAVYEKPTSILLGIGSLGVKFPPKTDVTLY